MAEHLASLGLHSVLNEEKEQQQQEQRDEDDGILEMIKQVW